MNIPPRKEEGSYAYSLREGAIFQVLLLTQTNPPFNLGSSDGTNIDSLLFPLLVLVGNLRTHSQPSYGPITLKLHAHLVITLSPRRGTILWLLVGVRFLPQS